MFNARTAELEGLLVKDPAAATKLLVAEKANAVAKFAAEEKGIYCSASSAEKRKAIPPTTRAPAMPTTRAPGHLLVASGIADVKQALQAYIATRNSYSHVVHTHARAHTHTQLGPAERPAPSSCKEWMQLQVNKHGSAISAHSYDKSQMQETTRSVLSLSLSLTHTHTHTWLWRIQANTRPDRRRAEDETLEILVPVTGTKISNGSQESRGRDKAKSGFSHT